MPLSWRVPEALRPSRTGSFREGIAFAGLSDPGDVARRVIDAVNAHGIDALRNLYAPDACTRRPGWPEPFRDVARVLRAGLCLRARYPAPGLDTTDGAHVVTEMRITGTNTGPTVLGDFGKALLGTGIEEVPPSGRPIELPAVFVHFAARSLAAGVKPDPASGGHRHRLCDSLA